MPDSPAIDLDALVKSAVAGPDTSYVKPTINKLRGIEAEREKETDAAVSDYKTTVGADKAEADKRFNAIEHVDIKPWTQKAPETDPIQAFGSAGSIFATIASAFTHTPMINSLNASAAAINAIKANDIAAYKDAYRVWKDNTQIALDRHKVQYDEYQAAMDKMKSDSAEGRTMLAVIAAKYGDRVTATLNEAGLYEKLGSAWAARQNAALSMAQALPRIEEGNLKIEAIHQFKAENPNATAQQLQSFVTGLNSYGSRAAQTPERIALDKYIADNPNASAQEIQDFLIRYKSAGSGQKPDAIALRKYIEENPDATGEMIQDFINRPKVALQDQRDTAAGERQDKTITAAGERQDKAIAAADDRAEKMKRADRIALDKYLDENPNATAQEIQSFRGTQRAVSLQNSIIEQRIAEKEKALGRPLTGEEKTQESGAVKRAGLTANTMQKLQERVDQFDNSADKIDSAIGILEKHIGSAGLAGRALRGKEIVANVFGSNETDRVQFRRSIEYLQAMSHRLLTDATGRPLSADAHKLDDVIGGLNLGDTTANTERSLREIQSLYAKMRGDTLMQLRGDWLPREERGAPTAASGGDAPWLNDPVVK